MTENPALTQERGCRGRHGGAHDGVRVLPLPQLPRQLLLLQAQTLVQRGLSLVRLQQRAVLRVERTGQRGGGVCLFIGC